MALMITYAQFRPVAKAAEVFGDRWTPIIMRELCFGARAFGELLDAAPLISRTVLAQRLKQLAQAGVVHIDAKPKGKGHLYRLTPAGEDFRPVVELMSVWGPALGTRVDRSRRSRSQNACMGGAPTDRPGGDTRAGLRHSLRFPRHTQIQSQPSLLVLVLRPDDIEVCLKAPDRNVDIIIAADLATFTKVWLGYVGLESAPVKGQISLQGAPRAIARVRRILALPDEPKLKNLDFRPSHMPALVQAIVSYRRQRCPMHVAPNSDGTRTG